MSVSQLLLLVVGFVWEKIHQVVVVAAILILCDGLVHLADPNTLHCSREQQWSALWAYNNGPVNMLATWHREQRKASLTTLSSFSLSGSYVSTPFWAWWSRVVRGVSQHLLLGLEMRKSPCLYQGLARELWIDQVEELCGM